MKRYPHISALLFDQPWAMTQRALESMIRRIEAAEAQEFDVEAVATKLGRPLENTGNRVELRDTVAVIDVTGPIFRYANVMTELSGATSVELLARDFQAAMDNPNVSQVVLNIDSPGGEIGGISDMADMIYAASRNRKPVTAFVDGLGASAAYWLASAAHKVYASTTAFTGSIGVVATITDRSGAQERQGVKTYTFVSSQSPRKVNDPATEEGKGAMQEMVDALGGLFVESVAKHRGVSVDAVLSDFGRGFVKPARTALQAGMIDGIVNFESLIASLQNNQQPTTAAIAAKEPTMPPEGTIPAAQPAAAAPAPDLSHDVALIDHAAERERNRIQSILSLPEAASRGDLARTLAFEPGMTLQAAQRILASAPVTPAAPAMSPLERAMANVPNPKVGTGEDNPDSPEAEAQRILSFLPSHQRIKVART